MPSLSHRYFLETTVHYENWSHGEYGTIGGARAPQSSFTGNNVVVYRNGNIGPRPGLRNVTPTGTPPPNGGITGFGFFPSPDLTTSHPLWYITGTAMYGFQPQFRSTTAQNCTAVTGALGAAVPTGHFIRGAESTRFLKSLTFFANYSDTVYVYNPIANTVGEIAHPGIQEGGNAYEFYKDILVTGSSNGKPERLWYSTISDPQDFRVTVPITSPDSNAGSVDIGYGFLITNLISFRDQLTIFTEDAIWQVTGSLTGHNSTLRKIALSLPAMRNTHVEGNDQLFYIPESRNAPVQFTGTVGDESSLEHLETWKTAVTAESPAITVVAGQSYRNRDIFFMGADGRLLWRKNDAWTKHLLYGGAIGPGIARYFSDRMIIATPGDSSHPPKFFSLDCALDRPAFTTDEAARPGDDSDTPLDASFSLPEYHTGMGQEVSLRGVEIEFLAYDTGSSVDNNITCTVDTWGQANRAGDSTTGKKTTGSLSWTGTAANASTTGRLVTKRFMFDRNAGTAYQISLSALKGVSIVRVSALIQLCFPLRHTPG